MKVLVVGSGAREHALAWRIATEGADVVCAPGNGGMAAFARCIAVSATDIAAIVELARKEAVDLVVVGPEAPLVAGLSDALSEAGIATFGPGREGAQLEGSKIFAKELMTRAGVPTAGYRIFDEADAAKAYIRGESRPLVVKADGLAAGKGVVVASDADEAVAAIDWMMGERAFGDAGARVLVEDCLVGEEVSYHVLSDGQRTIALASAQDHKRAYDGDRGPNTGGMGAYSPAPAVTPEIEKKILETIVEPTFRQLRADGIPFRGVLFIGLMIVEGEPYVLEYNVRFGDPECAVLMARWQGDLLSTLQATARGELPANPPSAQAPAALAVVLASGGYPGDYAKGKVIEGVEQAASVEGVEVFHAGTRLDGETLLTDGGRVLTVTAMGEDVDDAAERAYAAADRITFDGREMRRDIGYRARKRS